MYIYVYTHACILYIDIRGNHAGMSLGGDSSFYCHSDSSQAFGRRAYEPAGILMSHIAVSMSWRSFLLVSS